MTAVTLWKVYDCSDTIISEVYDCSDTICGKCVIAVTQ